MKFDLPADVLYLLGCLQEHGCAAYIVGGSVRDIIMERAVNDYDICTSAFPLHIKQIFSDKGLQVISVGEAHGTEAVVLCGSQYEITTFRKDGEYTDNRHPDGVEFCTDIATDLARRDFTVNAMAYNPIDGLVDPYGGCADIAGNILRAVGVPSRRFEEDALRILRAIRFAGQLGFSIEAETYRAICEQCEGIRRVSAERILTELDKCILSPFPECISLMSITGMTEHIFPELAETLSCDTSSLFDKIKTLPIDSVLRYSVLFGGIELSAIEPMLRRLKMSAANIRDITKLVKIAQIGIVADDAGVKSFLRSYGELSLERWLLLNLNPAVELAYGHIIQTRQPYRLSDLAIGGDEILELGIRGKDVGDALEKCLNLVILEPQSNIKRVLINYVKSMY